MRAELNWQRRYNTPVSTTKPKSSPAITGLCHAEKVTGDNAIYDTLSRCSQIRQPTYSGYHKDWASLRFTSVQLSKLMVSRGSSYMKNRNVLLLLAEMSHSEPYKA